MGRKSRQKGKRGELQWRDVLREHGYTEATRGRQHHGREDAPDVSVTGTALEGHVHFEVKRTEALHLWPALKQAMDDAGTSMPIVAHRPNRREWICILNATDLLRLLKLAHPPKPELAYQLEQP